MAKNGIITRKDIIEDAALEFGKLYADQLKVAIEQNKVFVAGIKDIRDGMNQILKAVNNSEYIRGKNAESLATQKATGSLKLQIQAEIGMEKIRKEKLITDKKAIELETAKLRAQTTAIRLTNTETGAYKKLNAERLQAQKNLANLLAAENKNTAAIILAEREFAKLDVRVKAVDAATKNYTKTIGNYKSAFTGFGATSSNILSTFGIVTGAALVATTIKDIFNVVREFDRQLIAVGKTINLRGEDLRQFGREVVELGENLNGVSITGLLSSAEVAGQLGVTGTKNILKFSRAIEELKLTSDIVSDEQVANFAKFIEVSSDSFENADKLGSVLTKLGNDFATTEAEALSNATEIQKGISVYNTAAASVLGLGAATASLGSEAEASRSAIQTTLGIINKAIATGEGLEGILKLTGLTQKELSEQFNKDATGVFVKFVKGLKDAKDRGENLSLVLSDLGIEEKRAFTVVGALAANYDVLNNAVNKANQEYIDNVSLAQEVEAASKSLNSIIGDIKDQYEAYILTQNDVNDGSNALATTLIFLRDNFKDIINFVLKAGAVLLTYLGAVKLVNFATTAATAINYAWNAAQIRFALSTGLGTRAILAQANAARAATVAQNGLNIATKATPWGIIIGLISAAVVAYIAFNDQLSKAEESQNRINDSLLRNKKTAEESAKAAEEFYNTQIKGIEDEFALRRAKEGDSKKLNDAEIEAKKNVTKNNIDTNRQIVISNNQLIDEIKKASAEKIKILTAEAIKLRTIADETTSYGLDIAAERAEAALLSEQENSKKSINALRVDSNAKVEENNKLNASLIELNKNAAIKTAEQLAEESKKEKAARLKRLKERYDAEKKAADDLFKLLQFRLQVGIELDEDILANEKKGIDERLDASFEAQQLRESKAKEAAQRELELMGKYNEETGKFVRQLSDIQINEIIETGKTSRKLRAEEQLAYEVYQKALYDAAKKGSDDRSKLNEEDAKKITEQAQKEFDKQFEGFEAIQKERDKISAIEIGNLNEKLRTRQITQSQYDKELLELQKRQNIAALNEQEQYLKDNLLALATTEEQKAKIIEAFDNIRKSRDEENQKEFLEKQEKQRKVITDNSKIIADALGIDGENLANFFNKTLENIQVLMAGGKVSIDDFAQSATAAISVIAQVSQNLSDKRLAAIDAEIEASNRYYENEIIKAGEDSRKKDLIAKEQKAKIDQLEKKKRQEAHKQAVLNKVLAIAQTSILAAQAAIKGFADSGYAGLILAVAAGAAAVATIIATPIPNAYKMGRKGGAAEDAIVGEGKSGGKWVPEVVTDKRGANPILYTEPSLIRLNQGDIVHKSTDDYMDYMKKATLAGVNIESERVFKYQNDTQNDRYSKEILDELKRNTAAVKKSKSIINQQKPQDLNYQMWRFQQINWRR